MPPKKRILIVEDEKDLSYLMQELLQLNGYDVIAAYDGKEGLKMAGACHPDLILLDLMLPQMDGRVVLPMLKFNPDTQNIPVIILTARGESKIILNTIKDGALDYLIKPFEHKELLALIERGLKLTSR